jgi:Protein-tyrosine phosphatase
MCREKSNESLNENKDIPLKGFANIHQSMVENCKEKIKEEYKEIQSWSESLDKTTVASVANQKLNRYSNIFPYDENRVVLHEDEFENDYINASYINVSFFYLFAHPIEIIFSLFASGLSLSPRVHRRSRTKTEHRARLLADGDAGQNRGYCHADFTRGEKHNQMPRVLSEAQWAHQVSKLERHLQERGNAFDVYQQNSGG